MSQRKSAITPFIKKTQQNKENSLLDSIDDTMEGVIQAQIKNKDKDNVGGVSQKSGSSIRLLFNQIAIDIQQKPRVSTLLISYLICVLYHLLNPYTISRFNQNHSEHNQDPLVLETIDQQNEDPITYLVLQFFAQDYFIYSSVRLFFHDKFLAKIEVKDLLVSFWCLYGIFTFSTLALLIIVSSYQLNMLILSICYCFLMFQYKKEQNSFKNLFQISMNFEQILRNSRRGLFDGQDENQNDQNQDNNQNQQEPQQNGNQTHGDGNDTDENEDNNHTQPVRLNQRRSNALRANPFVTHLVQQFVDDQYEKNQVSQLIQIGSNKWLVIYKVNFIKYACVFIGKSRLFTQKIDNDYIVLKYYWDSISKQSSPYSNEEVKKKYINMGIMYNTYTGKLIIFTIFAKGIKYLSILDIGIVNKDHIIMHQQQPKFVTLRMKELIFKDIIKNGMSQQTLADYQNRILQAYYTIEDTDYVISIEEESLIISSILSVVEWKPIGHDWEMELMMSNQYPSNDLTTAQKNLMKNHSYNKKQFFIQQKTKTKDFPTNIKCVNILNRRHLFVQDETHFYVYSIPTSQILQTIPNTYVQGFSIIPIYSTVCSPNLQIDQFLRIQKFTQKTIADSLSKNSKLTKNDAITTENPTLIYLNQYTSIPITFSNNQQSNNPQLFFIYPKQIQDINASAITTDNIFQIQQISLKDVLEQSTQ